MLKNKIVHTLILRPLSAIWENAYRLRRSFYEYGILKKEYFKVPIISIGNITFGGTGKTPMIIWLNGKLEKYGLESIVLTRGYKGNLEHKSGIIKGGEKFLSNPNEYGDEPLLISKNMSKGAVVVGKKRSQNLKKYFYDVNPDVVLLDDGFQHIQLYRSFNIVLFDALLPIESYKTAPQGYLREGLTALKDADAILISRADQVKEEDLDKLYKLIKKYHRPNIPMGRFKYHPQGLFNCFGEKMLKTSELEGKKVIALTAIASPESFYHLIEKQGAQIVDKMVYPDHHFFSHQDLADIIAECDKHDAIVVTSEKDMVKLKKVTKDPRVLSLNIGIKFLSGEDELFDKIRTILNLDYN
jgi:tetraacyldisaccharide 4'-kinase